MFDESKRRAGEARDEDHSGLLGVTSGLCPDLSAIRRGDIDGERRGRKRESGKKRSKLHGDAWVVVTPRKGV